MAKYEAMLVFRGDLSEADATNSLNDLVKVIKTSNLEIKKLGLKDLAYQIKGLDKGWYFQLNFSSEDQESMNEFRRISRISKALMRQLIINLEKDYGYKSSINPKKIERNKQVAENYKKKLEEQKAMESAIKSNIK